MVRDAQGKWIRLTDERKNHILARHPEMDGMEQAIVETLESPDAVIRSIRDPEHVREHYKWFADTSRGAKFLRTVVRYSEDDAFLITAHFTRRIPRRGE